MLTYASFIVLNSTNRSPGVIMFYLHCSLYVFLSVSFKSMDWHRKSNTWKMWLTDMSSLMGMVFLGVGGVFRMRNQQSWLHISQVACQYERAQSQLKVWEKNSIIFHVNIGECLHTHRISGYNFFYTKSSKKLHDFEYAGFQFNFVSNVINAQN